MYKEKFSRNRRYVMMYQLKKLVMKLCYTQVDRLTRKIWQALYLAKSFRNRLHQRIYGLPSVEKQILIESNFIKSCKI